MFWVHLLKTLKSQQRQQGTPDEWRGVLYSWIGRLSDDVNFAVGSKKYESKSQHGFW